MTQSIVRLANSEYNSGNYAKAFEYYLKAADLFGERFFRANIELCRRRLAALGQHEHCQPASSKRIIQQSLGEAKKKLVLTLLDPISELCWKGQIHGYPLVRSEYDTQIQNSRANYAFFESAWRANRATWEYAFTSPGLKHNNAQALLAAISELKKKGIPILFWNKEDPMHFEMFLPIAKLVDHVFTTDSLSIPNYRRELGHDRIYALPFAAPIEVTNPVDRFSSDAESACFAGTYYAKNHEDRKKQMDSILPTIIEFNGVIYDRASAIGGEKYSYPSEYHKYIRPAIDFSEMTGAYKKFNAFLNVNTITKSPTMMSRRVYELLASGTPVVSTPSKALTEQFPGVVLTASNKKEASLAVGKLLEDKLFWCQKSHLGIRETVSKHTYQQRWDEVLVYVEGKEIASRATDLSLVIEVGNIDLLQMQLQSVLRSDVAVADITFYSADAQCISRIKNLESFKKLSSRWPNLAIAFFENFGGISKFYLSGLRGKYIAFLSKRNFYHANYFSDQLLPFKYCEINAVAKHKVFSVPEIQDGMLSRIKECDYRKWHARVSAGSLSSALVSKEAIDRFIFDPANDLLSVSGGEKSIYMTDFFNMLTLRPGVEPGVMRADIFKYSTAVYI